MSELADIDDLAAEYVLGSLNAAERVTVAARRQREPALDAAIAEWERRLTPLAALVEDAAPPADLYARIERTIDDRITKAGNTDVSGEIVKLRRRLTAWRTSAIAGFAAAACLLVALGVREQMRTAPPQNFFAVFQKDDASPAFVMSIDLASRKLSIQRVAADVPPGKTYQLWIVSDKLAPGPHSLGLIEDSNDSLKNAINQLDPAVVQGALFGVSLEPAGGSKIGKPSGPALHSHLFSTM